MSKKKVFEKTEAIPMEALLNQPVMVKRNLETEMHSANKNSRLLTAMVETMITTAVIGRKFVVGRKRGTVGPMRKLIRKMLETNPEQKNGELWSALKASPPRGWDFKCNTRFGEYFTGPDAQEFKHSTFLTYAADERRTLRNVIAVRG